MKVINTWDSPEETTMNSNCADCRCDRPPMPAAGPWRTDVENAPEKQTLIGGFRDSYDAFFWYPVSRIGNTWVPDKPIAFATINRPEIEG